jgi:hypothetical protein
MQKSNTVWWIVGAIVIIALLGWAVTRMANSPLMTTNGTQATSTPVTGTTQGTTGTTSNGTGAPTGTTANSDSGLKETYANGPHSFTIQYPKELNAQPTFGVFHALNNNDWRFGATSAKRGTPVVDIPVIQIDNTGSTKKNYPLFYTARVRVGVSTDTAQCYAKDDGYTMQTVTDVTINGVAFKKFVFGDAAMQQYVNGASYRTIHDNKCYVLEQIQNGSSYKDETLVGGYTDADLANFYAQTTPIVMSFKFTK